MAIPNVGHVLNGWMKYRKVTTITQTVVNHQTVDTPSIAIVRMSIQPLPSQIVNRKPEQQRSWKWWSIWIKKGPLYKIDDIITVDDIDYKIGVINDWTEGGYQSYEAIEDYQ